MADEINPSHYRGFSNGAEVVDITERLNFNRGNAIKYLARAGRKQDADTLTDLRKALWYVQREIDRILTDGKETAEKLPRAQANELPSESQKPAPVEPIYIGATEFIPDADNPLSGTVVRRRPDGSEIDRYQSTHPYLGGIPMPEPPLLPLVDRP